jgi:deoxyadenosine/deoxycytidine kinase/DNA-binding XRE family transcriptional regulator
MNRSVIELGRLINSYRVERRYTQHELAEKVGSSRSAIALMEQGRRLLNAKALQTVSQSLGIPESVVAPFMSPAFQSRRNKVAPQPASFVPFQLLCVSGISGSGKTTLAKVIARTFGIDRIGSHPTGRAYLQDLAKDEDRWAFEAQVAFLVTKAQQIREKVLEDKPLVVERWIEEDVLVYERLFNESGAINPRSHETFRQVSKLARDVLPIPDLHLYCRCSAETARRRVVERERGDSRLHTIDFISRSKELYERWLDELEGPEIYILDTDSSDLSERGVIEAVFREIEWALTHDLRDPQMSLFESEPIVGDGHLQHIRPFHPERWSPINKTRRRAITSASPLVTPVAYLAAPFTGQDIEPADGIPSAGAGDYLFEEVLLDIQGAAHGIIPRHGFRNGLLGIERALTRFGLSVLIPHRDVNEWGKKQLTPDEAMRECTNHVSNCDLFIGILGNSCGAHYEFGLACACGKPCILIEVEEISGSFLARGTPALMELKSQDLLNLSCKRLKEAEDLLSGSPEVQEFLYRTFGRGISLPD